MPSGSLIPPDVKRKMGFIEKFAPKEVADQLKTLSEAERSFIIPVKLVDNDKEKYLLLAGMVISEKVPVNVRYDEIDLQLIEYALDKAKKALNKNVNTDTSNTDDG